MERIKSGDVSASKIYELDGDETLGSCLRIKPCSDFAPELAECRIQWYRVSPEGGKKELISGAVHTNFMHVFIFLVSMSSGISIVALIGSTEEFTML